MADWTEQDVRQIREWNEKDHPRGQPKNAGQFVEKSNNTDAIRHLELPKKEYAELCSAIRTRYADKIPKKGQLLYGDNYYQFKYKSKNEQLLCTYKLPIEGNEQIISEWTKIWEQKTKF